MKDNNLNTECLESINTSYHKQAKPLFIVMLGCEILENSLIKISKPNSKNQNYQRLI